MSNPISAVVRVRATFTAMQPIPLFIAGVDIIEGKVEPGMYANIPLNRATSVRVIILDTAPVKNDYGIEILGLVLDCDRDEGFTDFLAMLNIGDEIWDITVEGAD